MISTIHVTGNPVTDAVTRVDDMLRSGLLTTSKWQVLDPAKRLIVVTAHRRESFGQPFERICAAVRRIAERGDVQVVYPVHPNPNVRAHTTELLAGKPNIVLFDPLSYPEFIDLMRRSYLLLSDSGGVQEEAPSLGKPVLVFRETTERPEAVEAGTARLVGADEEAIVSGVNLLSGRLRGIPQDGTTSQSVRRWIREQPDRGRYIECQPRYLSDGE